MDWVLAWLGLVPNITYRKIIAYRMMYDFDRERYLYSLREVARRLHCSHQVIPDWHKKALQMLTDVLDKNYSVVDEITLYRSRRRVAITA